MDYFELEHELLKFKQEESQYREWYLKNPLAYEKPVDNWDDFALRYRASFPDMLIPSEALTFMGHNLVEKDWFADNKQEVTVIKNARYCPPFLHHLEFIKIIYLLRGQCTLFVDNRRIKMNQGNFCIISPNIEQTIFSGNDEDIVLNVIMKRSTFGNAFSSLLAEHGIISDFFWQMLYSKNSNGVMFFDCKSDFELDQTVLNLYKEAIFEKNASNLLLKSFVLIFFAYVLRNHQDKAVSLGNIQESYYNLPKVISYMKENMKYVTLASLAEHFQMSEGYLSRYIRKETGYTFSYLLRDFRMKQAAEMLRHSKCSIEKIIETVGYADESHFYRCFKQMYGMTPSTYRHHKNVYII